MSYVYDFMQGWKFIDSIQDRERQLAEHAEDRAWQSQQRDWERQRQADEEELKRWAEREKLILAYGFNPDGTEKPYEQLQQEGHLQDMLEMWNHPDFAPMRNAHGRDVKLTGVYGRGNQMIYTADVTDPKTGEVISRGMPLTQNRFTDSEDPDRKDPVRVVTMKQQLDDVRRGLIMKGQLYAQKYTQGQAAQHDRGLIDRAIGYSQPQAPSTTPGAPSAQPSQDQGQFIKTMYDAALRENGGNHEAAVVAVAQAALETGWGKSAPGNNYFGIKAHGKGGGPGLATLEYDPHGNPYNDRASFRQYGSMEESLAGRTSFLSAAENPRYAKAGYDPATQTAEEQAEALARAGYATDPDYAGKLKQIIGTVRGEIGAQNAPRMRPAPNDPRGLARDDPATPVQPVSLAQGYPGAQLQGVGPQRAVTPEAEEALIREMDSAYEPRAPFTQANIDAVQTYADLLQTSAPRLSSSYADSLEAARQALPADLARRVEQNPKQAATDARGFLQAAQQPVAVQRTAAQQAPIDRSRPIIGGEAIPPRGALTSPAAPGAQPVEFSPQPKAQLTAEQQREQRGVLTEMVQRKIISLKDAQEIARTGQLGGEDLKFVADGYGGVGVFHPRTGQQVAYHENPTIQALKAQGSRRRGSNSEGKGSEYAKTRIELEAKAYKNAPWAKGADGKYDPDLVERDIRRTLAVNRPVLVEWGFPSETADWTEADWDRYLEWYGQSRKGDKEEEHWANFLPGVDVTYRTDTQGQLNQTVARGNGPQEPVMQLPDGRVVNLEKMIRAGVAPDLETARQMVEQALRAQGAG